MIRKYKFLLAVMACLIWSNAIGSANTFIRETERLIALSDTTYTVIVKQYEQTYSYWTGINRLIIRVIDINTNKIISEILLSSTQADTAMEKPYETTYSLIDEESQAIGNMALLPQTLYENLMYPKYRFRIDSKGVYIEKNGRQNVLEFSVVSSRFSNESSKSRRSLDSKFDLKEYVDSNNYEFTGWYKENVDGKLYFFFALKLGLVDDDTGGLEYVFSIPNSEG